MNGSAVRLSSPALVLASQQRRSQKLSDKPEATSEM